MITTHTDDARNIVAHYDTEATEPVNRFVIWFEGRDRIVVAEDLPCVTWERVCTSVQDMRRCVDEADRRDPEWNNPAFVVRGNPHRQAHVYCGITPTREQVAGHMRQWVIWMLWKLTCPRLNKNPMGQVAALGMLAELYGLHQPQPVYVTPPTLEQLDAEIARRKVQ